MTHDELLAKIIGVSIDVSNTFPELIDDNLTRNVKALRAVVELHKPVDCEALDGSQGTMCINCCDGFYPCLTIQTIEWNLNEL